MPTSRLFYCLFLVFSFALALEAEAAPPRQEISLNGQWQVLKVAELAYPPEGDWKPMDVPGYLNGINYERAWLWREFSAPPAMRGQRMEIAFGGVKFNSVVYLNGRKVGGHFGGYEAFNVDVTDHVHFDRPNELLVGVCDWTGVFADRDTKLDLGKGQDARGIPKDEILAPVGGLIHLYGIWDDVTLRSHPPVYIRDCFIQPSVRRKELAILAAIANTDPTTCAVRLAVSVRDAAGEIWATLPRDVAVAAGSEAEVELRCPWANPRLWSHEDPYLYQLRLSLKDSLSSAAAAQPPADEIQTRFGFREFWTDGPDFYLNGQRIHMLATASWPPRGPTDRDSILKRMKAIKASHTFAFRTHTQPWPEVWYEAADEAGLLMIPEGAIWNDENAYRINDPRFWDNYAAHLRAMVDRLKNHPSVVMWSLENEFYGGRFKDTALGLNDLVRMGALMKEWDPTRPITYESDGDPGGMADVIGIHYPHEYPQFTQWPNEADWLDAPIPAPNAFLGGKSEFFWERKKPLYIGEFLWVPSADPSWHTVFYGDEAYIDYDRYKRLAKGQAWRMQILGCRRHEVSGISPWTMMEGGALDEANPMYQAHVWAFRPVAAFLREYDRNFFAGERVERTADLYNDTLKPGDFDFSWKLSGPGAEDIGAVEPVTLPPGAHVVRKWDVPAPSTDQPTSFSLLLEMRQGGKSVFREDYPFIVYPRPRLQTPPGASIGLLDPAGQTAPALARLGLEFRPLSSLEELGNDINLLIVGAEAFAAAQEPRQVIIGADPAGQGLDSFLRAGGRVLVLEQKVCPAGLFPASLSSHRSTMTFAFDPGHPALAGIAPEDLKFWRGDHRVTAGEPQRPNRGGGRALIVSGSREGVAHAPLLEFHVGQGALLLSQLLLIEKLESEPTAARLLQNCLDYLAAYRPSAGRTAVIAADPAFSKCLRSLGLRFDDLSGKLPDSDLSPYRLLIAQGDADPLLAGPAGLEALMARDGAVLLHRPTPEGFAKLRPLHGSDLMAQPYDGPVALGSGDDPLLHAFAREDLYWLGKHTGKGWFTTPRAGGMADFAFSPAGADKALFLTNPPALIRIPRGKGAVVVDPIRWDTEQANGLKAARFACSLLSALGAQFEDLSGVSIEAESMEPDPKMPHFKRYDDYAALNAAGYIETTVDIARAGAYRMEIVAGGTPAKGIYPIVQAILDGRSLGEVELVGGAWRAYSLRAALPAGKHTLRLAYVNDLQSPPEDRNLRLDKVVFYAEQQQAPDESVPGQP